jgi:hypothetical protein
VGRLYRKTGVFKHNLGNHPAIPIMSKGQPPCPRCEDDLFVRKEQIISGRRFIQAFYCGRCNHEWQVAELAGDTPERRQRERRTRPRQESEARKK